MRYSVVLDIFGIGMCLPKSLFPDTPTLCELMEMAADAGYKAVEFWDWADRDMDMIETQLKRLNLNLVSICSRDRGTLTDATTHDKAMEGFLETIHVAKRLQCKNIVVTAGNILPQISHEKQRENVVNILCKMGEQAKKENIIVILEPISAFSPRPIPPDAPKVFLSHSQDAFDILRDVGSPNVKLLFDIFHQQFTEGNVLNRLLPNLSLVGHIHAAGNPGRKDITRGELDYHQIFEAIANEGYGGYIGLEYFADGDKKSSLMEAHRILV